MHLDIHSGGEWTDQARSRSAGRVGAHTHRAAPRHAFVPSSHDMARQCEKHTTGTQEGTKKVPRRYQESTNKKVTLPLPLPASHMARNPDPHCHHPLLSAALVASSVTSWQIPSQASVILCTRHPVHTPSCTHAIRCTRHPVHTICCANDMLCRRYAGPAPSCEYSKTNGKTRVHHPVPASRRQRTRWTSKITLDGPRR